MNRWIKYAVTTVPLLMAAWSWGDIAGSAHDFTTFGWADNGVCKPCHTPHNAIATGITGRLWAHTLSNATYTYFAAPDGLVMTTLTQADIDGASRLCLSCHDGTVALDNFMGKNGASDGQFMGAAGHGGMTANLGTDLSNDHPIGYKAMYKENTRDAGHYSYKTLASAKSAGLKFATSQDAVAAVPSGSLDQSGAAITYTNWPAVSCVTCHDVHNGTLPTEPYLMRVTLVGSQLCLTCHNR